MTRRVDTNRGPVQGTFPLMSPPFLIPFRGTGLYVAKVYPDLVLPPAAMFLPSTVSPKDEVSSSVLP